MFSQQFWPQFWPLDARIRRFWPQIRNLRKKSSLGPDSQVWNRVSSLKNLKFIFHFFFNTMSGLVSELGIFAFVHVRGRNMHSLTRNPHFVSNLTNSSTQGPKLRDHIFKHEVLLFWSYLGHHCHEFWSWCDENWCKLFLQASRSFLNPLEARKIMITNVLGVKMLNSGISSKTFVFLFFATRLQ